MSVINLIEGFKRNSLSEVKEVFTKDTLDGVRISCYKCLFDRNWIYSATIAFKNDKTKGEQDIKADSFTDLLEKVKIFLESLE